MLDGGDARKRLQSRIDEFVSMDADNVAELDSKITVATDAVTEARDAFRRADGNQIYRSAASWFRVSTSDVTAEQFAATRWVFTTFSAVAVALAGSIAALVYYARACVTRSSPLRLQRGVNFTIDWLGFRPSMPPHINVRVLSGTNSTTSPSIRKPLRSAITKHPPTRAANSTTGASQVRIGPGQVRKGKINLGAGDNPPFE